MSLYRDAERQRRKRWRQQQRKRGGKKSSLGALSASLTALFAGGNKDSVPSSDCGDNGYYYGASETDADRVEYVTVRGCRPSRDDNDSGGELSTDDENHEAYDSDFDGDDTFNHTKGMAQMAVTLGEYKRFFLIFLPTRTYTAECYYYLYVSDVIIIIIVNCHCYIIIVIIFAETM